MSEVGFVLLARHSGKCLDVALASQHDGAPVHQWDCSGGANQQWYLLPVGDGSFRLLARHSGKCLDVAMASRFDEAQVHQWGYLGAANQHWRVEATDPLFCLLRAAHSDKCLHVSGLPRRGDGARVLQVADLGGDNQRWLLVADLAAYPGPVGIASRLDGRRLVAAGESSNAVELLASSALPGDGWTWRIRTAAGGARLLCGEPESARRSLDLAGEGHLVLVPEDERSFEVRCRWALERVGDVVYRFVHHGTGNCLEALPADVESGSAVACRRPYCGEEAQQWLLVPELAGCSRALPLWPLPGLGSGEALAAAIVRTCVFLPRYRLGEEVPADIASLLEGRSWPTAAGLPQEPISSQTSLAPGVFLSYAARDRALARRIAEGVRAAGIAVWLDEWEIRVGDSIAGKIQEGLERMAFVAVLLTRSSAASGWVEKEWQSKLELEARERRVAILPLRGDDAPMPPLLRDRKYADFSRDFQAGLRDLVRAVRLQPGPEWAGVTTTAPAGPPRVRFITEGGSNAVYFLLANPEAGRPVVVSGVGVKADIWPDALSGIERVDLADYFEPEEGNVAALNLSTGDYRLLTRGSIHIAPGEIVPCSLRLCCRYLDRAASCRLMVRLVGTEEDYFLPSDCVYLLSGGDPYGSLVGPSTPVRLLVDACLRIEEVRQAQRAGRASGPAARIPKDLLEESYSLSDLRRIGPASRHHAYWNFPLTGKL